MKKTVVYRIGATILAFCLFGMAVLMLSSCQKTKKVDIAEYRIVYATDLASTAYKSRIERFAADLTAATGVTVSSETERVAEAKCEILVGGTNRTESGLAAAEIEGDGYAICQKGNKIVIIGTTRVLTAMALEVFLKECLPVGGGTALSVPKKMIVSNMEMVELDENYRVVYSSTLDDTKGNSYNNDTVISANPNGYDYPVQAAYDLRGDLASVLGKKANEIKITDDALDIQGKEICVGKTNRSESAALLSWLNADTYGVSVTDESISVCGINDAGTRAAVTLFKTIVSDAKRTNAEGKTVVCLPRNMLWIATRNTSWYTDFPKPEGEGVALTHSQDVSDKCVAYYYTGEGVDSAVYETYTAKLEASGYRLREENTVGKSLFSAYVSDKDKAVLYVSFAAFEHGSNQGLRQFEPTLRIVSAYLENINILEESLLIPQQEYVKVTDSKITSMRLSYKSDNSVYGNAYIITLEDGSMVVYDGGMTIQEDTVRLYNVLRDLHRRSFGELPTASKPITIAAWILSHGHGDHYGNFLNLCDSYGSHIVVEKLLANFTSDDEDYNSYNPTHHLRDQLTRVQNLTKKGIKYVKVHTGEKFYLRNMEIEVLYTHEDLGEIRYNYFNDSSIVFRTTFYSTDGKGNREGVPTSALWLGDLFQNGSKCMRAMYGPYLKSDMVQLAHHGFQGCELSLYRLVSPTCIWWPSSEQFFKTATNPNSDYAVYRTNHAVANDIASVKYIIIQDAYNTTVTITKEGADYRLQSESETGLVNAGLLGQGYAENDYNPITKYGGSILKKK